jgi:hypothetical protein
VVFDGKGAGPLNRAVHKKDAGLGNEDDIPAVYFYIQLNIAFDDQLIQIDHKDIGLPLNLAGFANLRHLTGFFTQPAPQSDSVKQPLLGRIIIGPRDF